jgi:hypothetical protein
MTRGQLLQVNFAPVWHGRVISEMEMITKRILTRNPAMVSGARILHLNTLSEHSVMLGFPCGEHSFTTGRFPPLDTPGLG